MPQPLDELNQRFAIPNIVAFDSALGGLTRLRITHPAAAAEIYLHGGHVAGYKPQGCDPVIFVSSKSAFADGKPIRGGVPVCFPWFGAKENDPSGSAPMHGFARLHDWTVESVDQEKTGVTILLGTASNDATRKVWPYDFELKHRITVGPTLTLSLEMRNAGRTDLSFEEALHTYFRVGDVRKVRVHGLEGGKYVNKVDGQTYTQDAKPIAITEETDRLYSGATGTCVIEDPILGRRIHVEKAHSRTTVVWNPWVAKAKAMPDFGDDEWPNMVCVETVNARRDAVMLQPGGRHAMTATIRLERI